MGSDVGSPCLRAALSGQRIWTDRKVTVEDGDLVKTFLNEFLYYFGNESDGEVQRRWVLTTVLKNSGKYISTKTISDSDVDDFLPEADIQLPEPPEGVGKSRDELFLDAKKRGVL